MPVIHVDAQVSPEQLLKAVEQLPSNELVEFVNEIAALQVRRGIHGPAARESDLILRINRKLPAALQQRFEALILKRESAAITEAELGELIAITDQSERLQADRIRDLAELAALRKTTVPALMDELGIRTPPHGPVKS